MGKTTVIAPLLALMLADGKRLVVQIVPEALLSSSLDIMQNSFSSLMRKPVFHFNCSRSSALTEAILLKFEDAIRSRAIVISTPSAIKALLLKHIEAVHHLCNAAASPDCELPDLQHLLMTKQRTARILSLFRGGSLIMDEVDLILHPLKSEMNFPVGNRVDLDFQVSTCFLSFTSIYYSLYYNLICYIRLSLTLCSALHFLSFSSSSTETA